MQGRCLGCTVGMGGSCGTTPIHPQYAPCIQAELLSNLPPEQPHAISQKALVAPLYDALLLRCNTKSVLYVRSHSSVPGGDPPLPL